MADTKVVVIYPRPTDVDAFEKVYVEEHVPLAMEKIKGVTRCSRDQGAPGPRTAARPALYRIAELYFPSVEALQKWVASAGT